MQGFRIIIEHAQHNKHSVIINTVQLSALFIKGRETLLIKNNHRTDSKILMLVSWFGLVCFTCIKFSFVEKKNPTLHS